MNIKQLSLTENNWKKEFSKIDFHPNLFLLFISPDFKFKQDVLNTINKQYANATIIGCSTAGEISDISVNDKTISLTAIRLEKVVYKKEAVKIKSISDSFNAGKRLANKLYTNDLKHVIIFSDGLNIDGSDLVSGLQSKLPNIGITGGLAADGTNFNNTFVINNNTFVNKTIIGLGLYGKHLKVGFGSRGGFDSFGVDRLVTKSKHNTLYELDGVPALKLYRSFLGEEDAKNLPESGVNFPLGMREDENKQPVVRTVYGISEEEQSLIFTGKIIEGSYIRLMKSNVDRLINASEDSAIIANKSHENQPELVILISCVGRRAVLKQLIEEEVEVVRDVVGNKSCITGFYSYGEIAPFEKHVRCQLHNQTMTITTLSEC